MRNQRLTPDSACLTLAAMNQSAPLQASTFIVCAAVSGFIAVALGAFGAHALRELLDVARQGTWETAVHYQMFHVVALLAVGLLAREDASRQLRWSGWCFVAGTLLFSGSLYLLALSGQRWLGMVTPLGGVAFLAGWGLLFFAARQLASARRHSGEQLP